MIARSGFDWLRCCATLVVLLSAAPLAAQHAAPVQWLPCDDVADAPVGARCATLLVPRDHAAPTRPDSARLFFVHVPARTSVPERRVAVLLPGGPGHGASGHYALLAAALGSAGGAFEFLLVDQRGTGRSEPASCDAQFDGSTRWPGDASQRCRAGAPSDPREWGSATAARDLEAVRAALGTERLLLYGISYGGRVALEYARRFPDRVDGVVLHSPVTERSWLSGLARAAQRALDGTTERCRLSGTCGARRLDARRELHAALRAVDERPPVLRFIDHEARRDSVVLTASGLAHVVHASLYSPEDADRIASALRELRLEGASPLIADRVRSMRRSDRQRSMGAALAITCLEDAPALPPASSVDARLREPIPWVLSLHREVAAACAPWRSLAAATPLAQGAIAAPTLAFTGELDPVTPPDLYLTLEGPALHRYTVRGQGHGRIWECTLPIVEAFLSAPRAPKLTTPACAIQHEASR